MKLLGCSSLLFLVFAAHLSTSFAAVDRCDRGLHVQHLRCEYRENPLGIDVTQPRLSWNLKSPARGQKQTAYQVVVAESETQLTRAESLWDSGKVASNQTIQVAYNGPALESLRRYYWKVRVWDRHGTVSDWSDCAWWETAFLGPEQWTARWINDGKSNPERDEAFYDDDPGPLFRREFLIDKRVQQARLYVSGLGYYEARLNGSRVGDRQLDPAWTTYSERVLYSAYDVTEQLRTGKNCLGAMLGNGWYNVLPMRMWGQLNLRQFLTLGRPRLLAQLHIEYADGTRQDVVTDENWKVTEGPIIRNSIYLGEAYDARQEQPGWDRPGFDDSGWSSAQPSTEKLGSLESQSQPPIRQTATLKPVQVSHPNEGVTIFDMGQNIAGSIKLRVQGPAGTVVKLRYGELLHSDGTLNVMTSVCGQIKEPGKGGPGAPPVAEQCDTYILRGEGSEVYSPRFTYHGFRYVEVTGYPGELAPDAIEAVRLNSDVAEVGSFSCSNELLNRIQQMVRKTFPSNLLGVQTDCPARERFAYGDDIACAAEAHLVNYDMATFYAKTARDFADAARPDGALTLLAPWTGHAIGGFDPGGGSFANVEGGENVGSGAMSGVIAHPLLLDKLYQYYGDRRLLAEQYESARRSLEFIRPHADGHIITVGLGDWSSVEPTTASLLSTAFYYHHAEILSRLATVLGRQDDARQYAVLSQKIKDALNGKFLKPGTGQYDVSTQAGQAFALYYDLVPPDQRQAATRVLLDDILVEHQAHLTTGIFGTKYLLEVLTRIGRADVAYRIVNQKTYPGWGFMLESGATTMWEVWHFSDNIYSHNHSMFGTVSAWFLSALAGIQPDPAAVGFDKIIIRPQVVGDLTWAKGSYRSIRGMIVSDWRVEDDSLDLNVEIPVNTTATVYVPAQDALQVTESGQPAGEADGVMFLRLEAGAAVYEVGSGRYAFQSKTDEAGFVSLFDGKTLQDWSGDKDSFAMEEGLLVSQAGARGNLLTKREYGDFVLRFDFRLTPGANNGLGIRVPREGDLSYNGIELQILDNSAEKYKDLKPYQYHGSAYGIAPALRGFLQPVGQWNRQEVRCQDRRVVVILNGSTILDVDLDEAAPDGKTMDAAAHPGLNRRQGHIGFLCHGDRVAFRNIRIQELSDRDAPQE